MQPHRHRYWLNAKPDNPEEFSTQVKFICQLHQKALELFGQGIHVVSTDEMTGIQALERLFANQPAKPKRLERIEFEYKRHGTLSLIANWHIATGKVLTPSIGATRTEQDFEQQDLKQKILNFIDYFNSHFAKPFVWKFEGFKEHR